MIISLSGKMRSGKNTTANVIQYIIDSKESGFTLSESNYNDYIKNKHYLKCKFEQKSFAGKLKQIASILTGATLEQLEDQDFKKQEMAPEWGITYRELLQKLGTEAMRNGLHENVWVNALIADYSKYINQATGEQVLIDDYLYYKNGLDSKAEIVTKQEPNWCITDMRFPNEMDAVKAKGGITIRVNRVRYISTHSEGEHESERALDNHKFDYVIDNNGTISDLIDKVKDILTLNNII